MTLTEGGQESPSTESQQPGSRARAVNFLHRDDHPEGQHGTAKDDEADDRRNPRTDDPRHRTSETAQRDEAGLQAGVKQMWNAWRSKVNHRRRRVHRLERRLRPSASKNGLKPGDGNRTKGRAERNERPPCRWLPSGVDAATPDQTDQHPNTASEAIQTGTAIVRRPYPGERSPATNAASEDAEAEPQMVRASAVVSARQAGRSALSLLTAGTGQT